MYWIHESGQSVIPIIELLEPKERIYIQNNSVNKSNF